MLFHATPSHDYSTCHAHDEERKALMIKSMQSADSMEQIVQFFDPMIELGNIDIHPVLSLQDALDQIKKD